MGKRTVIIILIVGCIAISAGVGIFVLSSIGINTAQQSQRDTQRRSTLMQINLMVNNYYGETGSYPHKLVLTEKLITFASEGGESLGIDKVDLKLPATGGLETTQQTTAYCYVLSGSSYKLGVKLEEGKWLDVGTSSEKCSDADRLPISIIPTN